MVYKRGALNLSFGMIFSIILIIAFLVFAFYAIKTFLGVSDAAKIANFRENLQNDIDEMWRSSGGVQEVSYSLPRQIEKVCFVEDDYENLIFVPEDAFPGLESKVIEHVDILRITSTENNPLENGRFCIEVMDSKVEMTLRKSFDENLVMITR